MSPGYATRQNAFLQSTKLRIDLISDLHRFPSRTVGVHTGCLGGVWLRRACVQTSRKLREIRGRVVYESGQADSNGDVTDDVS